MIIKIDRYIYTDSCISKTIYRLSGDYTFRRSLENNTDVIEVSTKTEKQLDENVFWDLLNDYKLRELIDSETKEIRTILFAKAFADFDELTEDDLQY